MKLYNDPFTGLSDIEDLKERIRGDLKKKSPETVHLSGVTDAGKALVTYGIGSDLPSRLIVTAEEGRAKELYEEYSFFDPDTSYYPGKDLLFFQSDVRGNALTIPRICALKQILSGGPFTVVTTVRALMNRLPDPAHFRAGIRTIRPDDEVDLEEFRRFLLRDGYEAASEVSQQGEFAVRGGIIDIFPLTEDQPVRIELFGDEVDTIREFDVTSQRSGDQLEEVHIFPAQEAVFSEKEIDAGIDRMKKDTDGLVKTFKKEGKPEEAHHLKGLFEETEEKIRNGWLRQEVEVCLPYFTDHTEGLLDYLPEDTVLFLD